MARKPSVLLSAFGIHMGGGLVLLKALTVALGDHLKYAALDARLPQDPAFEGIKERVTSVRRSFLARIASLFQLHGRAEPDDVLLCLNSLPPLRPARCRVVVYLHALYLVGMHRDSNYTLQTRLRIWIERIWFKWGIRHADECWVQTPSMAQALQKQHPSVVVRILPFVDEDLAAQLVAAYSPPAPSTVDASGYVFFYPAEAVGHKNHPTLLRAWSLLHRQGLFPQLLLTLEDAEMARVSAAAEIELDRISNVRNLGRITRPEALQQLAESSALIFPSLAETLGLPLLEARALSLPILASERNFVRDVCTPHQSFDPHSPQSIANAVQRFMGAPSPALQFLNATQLVAVLTEIRAH